MERAGLTPAEMEAVRQVEVEKNGITIAARNLGKDKATVSLQHKYGMAKIKLVLNESERHAGRGMEEAVVFKYLDQRRPLPWIVEKTGIESEAVEKYHKAYLHLREVDLNYPSTPRDIRELREKLSRLEDDKVYWDYLFCSVPNMDGFQGYCINCVMTKMVPTEDGMLQVCPKCGWTFPP